MSIEINNSLLTIEKTCGECPKISKCVFGKPALQTLGLAYSNQEKAAAISYISGKRTETVVNGCPKTEVVFQAVDKLKKS